MPFSGLPKGASSAAILLGDKYRHVSFMADSLPGGYIFLTFVSDCRLPYRITSVVRIRSVFEASRNLHQNNA